MAPIDTSLALASEEDPTYTHFKDKDVFMALLDQFLAIPLTGTTNQQEEKAETKLVESIGAVVRNKHFGSYNDIFC